MLNKRILVLMFLVVFIPLVGCFPGPSNETPIITSVPITTATVGEAYTYDVNATDPDDDTLTYSLTVKPTGMFINSATGLIKWTPIPVQVGDNSVIVTVSDGFLNITQSFTITVIREEEPGVTPPVKKYTITATADTGGSINPLGEVKVKKGTDKTFTITPDTNYNIADVLVDGSSVTALSSYTFTNVTANHTIHATFVVRYSFTDTQFVSGGTVGSLVTTVAEDGDWMVWTFDFPVEEFTGDGNLNVGLIVALDGEGQGPAFQIHNNDGATGLYPVGTWMYGSWGPTITDGWFGWPNHDLDVPIAGLDWVSATGNRNVPHGDGVMVIRIKKSELGNVFHWAASPTVGTGFWAPASDITMQIPTDFDWGVPVVDMTIPNYIAR